MTLKAESATRWSARIEAVRPVYLHTEKIVELLEGIAEDETVSNDTKSDAHQILCSILKFEFLCLLRFWHKVLTPIDRVQKMLQDPTSTIRTAAEDLKSLVCSFNKER